MKVVFATPTYSRTPCEEFTESCVRTEYLLRTNGVEPVWGRVGGDPYVHKARNRLASGYLREYPDAPKLFLLDDDLGWPEEKVLQFVSRPEDVICGVYPKKTDDTDFPVEMLLRDGKVVQQDGLYEAALAATGFMCIRREVLERCAEDSGRYPQIEKGGDYWCWDLFRTGFIADEPGGKVGRWWGEDYFFAVMCRHLGFRVWIDPDIEFTHRGSKAWRASFGPTLRAWIEQNGLKSETLAA